MSGFFDLVFGLLLLGFMTLGTISMLSGMFSKSPPRRRSPRYRRSPSRQGHMYPNSEPRTSRSARPYTGISYTFNPEPNTFLVYLLENQSKYALKLGVGSWGRVHEFLESRERPDASSDTAGWTLLRVARFSSSESEYDEGRLHAYEAERRAHFYWRYIKRAPRHLNKDEMGYSQMLVLGEKTFVPTQGFTETVKLGSVCEVTTWNLVKRSPGYQNEFVPEGARELSLLDTHSVSWFVPDGYEEAQIKRIRHDLPESRTPEQKSDIERFWEKVEKTESCWLWTGAKIASGYGVGTLQGKTRSAQRIAWELEIGSDPGLFFLQNDCGNRNCVFPQHWSISLRRRSLPGEIRISEFQCTRIGCTRPARTLTQPGLCELCRQQMKRKRRRQKNGEVGFCQGCGLDIERRGAPSGTELCTSCRNRA